MQRAAALTLLICAWSAISGGQWCATTALPHCPPLHCRPCLACLIKPGPLWPSTSPCPLRTFASLPSQPTAAHLPLTAGALYYKSFSKGGSSHKGGSTPKAPSAEGGDPSEKLPLVHADATATAQVGIGAEQK